MSDAINYTIEKENRHWRYARNSKSFPGCHIIFHNGVRPDGDEYYIHTRYNKWYLRKNLYGDYLKDDLLVAGPFDNKEGAFIAFRLLT